MEHLQTIKSLLDQACHEHIFSGYQFHGQRGEKVFDLCGGVTGYWGEVKPVGLDTLFDIGSVTKVVLTTSLFALAVQSDEINLSSSLDKFIPEFEKTVLAPVTLLDLISHSSGLIAWYPLYLETDGPGLIDWFKNNAKKVLQHPHRKMSIYSDLGFLLLGEVIKRMLGDLEENFKERIVKPLGLSTVSFGPIEKKENVAATEYSLVRKHLLQGEVFDDNCFALGGKCGHAGLFASSQSLGPWAREWLKAIKGDSSWLRSEVALQFSKPANLVSGSTHALGWDLKSRAHSTCGDLFSMQSFGHLGYPGCSVWIDPENDMVAILLTNRVHPSRFDNRIQKIRPLVHNAWANNCLG